MGPRDAGLLGRSNASFYYYALLKVFEVDTRITLTDLRGNLWELTLETHRFAQRAIVQWVKHSLGGSQHALVAGLGHVPLRLLNSVGTLDCPRIPGVAPATSDPLEASQLRVVKTRSFIKVFFPGVFYDPA